MKVGMIGFGHITEHHFKAAEVTGAFAITAVCDTDPEVLSCAPSTRARYADSHELLKSKDIDAVIVATPTATHFALASQAIKAGKPVLIEKPITTTQREFDELQTLSERSDVPVVCLFHYAPASEVVASRAYLEATGAKRHAALHSTFYDPYNTNFDLEQFSLMNSWIDHGINQLSIVFSLWPDVQLKLTQFALTPPKGPRLSTVGHSVEFTFTAGAVTGMIVLESNWSIGQNYKTTRVHISNPDHLITLEHMQESVLIDNQSIKGLTFATEFPRLTNHYVQLFPQAASLIARGVSNWAFARRVHAPLFEVLEQAHSQQA